MNKNFNSSPMFGLGDKNINFSKYFTGGSYLKVLSDKDIKIYNVTFEATCRNNWHIHHKGGQILLVVDGVGYYQEWGKSAQKLHKGDVVNISPEVKHWHGASKEGSFTHIAIEVPAENSSVEWLEKVEDNEYNKLD